MDKTEQFTTAIKNNEGIIYKIASVYTNDVDDKHDLAQEIIYQLWKSFDSFSNKSSLSTWIYRVAMNVAIYHLKSNKRKVPTVQLDESHFQMKETVNNDFEEKLKVFKQQLVNLNLLDKGIVMLYLENKSYQEIAQIIGISESNVGTKISRIKEKLKNQINKQS